MEIDKSILLGHLELLQGIGGSSRSDYDLTNKVIITKEGLINSFQGAFVTFVEQVFDFEGVFDLPTFVSIVKSIKSDMITIDDNADKEEIILSALRTKVGLKKIEVPELNEIIQSIEVDSSSRKKLPDDFILALNLCSSCASKGNSNLTNILVSKDKMVGSDNDKMGIYDIKMSIKKSWLIENELAGKIIKLSPVDYVEEKGKIVFFRSDSIYSICTLSEAEYPDLTKIMEKKTSIEVPIPSELKEGIDVSFGLFTSIREQEKLMKISLLKNRVILRTESDLGWMDKTVRIKYSGKEFSFWVNTSLFKEMMEKVSVLHLSEEGILKFNSDNFTCILPIDLKA
ncbi:MAG: hypothetical protein WC516_09440 [Patescibacteria group bacterium]